MSISADTRRDLVRAFEQGLDEFTAVATAPGVDLPGLPARPSATELAEIEGRNRARLVEARQAVYDASVPRGEVAHLLDVSPNQVSNLLASDRLVAIDGPDGQRFPAWQFDLGAQRVRVEGIHRVMAAMPAGVLGLSQWMTTPTPTLDGRTPGQALAAGEVDAVVTAASAVGA